MIVCVYELKGHGAGPPLYVEIPEQLLPPGSVREIDEEEPGYYHEYPRWIKLKTGLRSKDGRLPVFLYKEPLRKLNIDINKMPSIKIQGLPLIWFDAHLIYRWEALPFYGRVWLPRRAVEGLNLKPESTILVKIRGYSFPRKRRITVVERYVEVEHMNKTYLADVQDKKWMWIIPENIEGYPVLLEAIKRNYLPIAECKNHRGRIYIDLRFRRPAGQLISENMGYAYRTMSLRNYVSRDEKPSASYLLVELRATIICSLPKQYPKQDPLFINIGSLETPKMMTMRDALKITVRNMSMFFTQSIRHAEKQSKVMYTEGEEDNKKISYGETILKEKGKIPFYYVDKYIRITNEYSYKNDKEFEYFNERIESDLKKNPLLEVDEHGFVWIEK
jgi:hypothetical protein